MLHAFGFDSSLCRLSGHFIQYHIIFKVLIIQLEKIHTFFWGVVLNLHYGISETFRKWAFVRRKKKNKEGVVSGCFGVFCTEIINSRSNVRLKER